MFSQVYVCPQGGGCLPLVPGVWDVWKTTPGQTPLGRYLRADTPWVDTPSRKTPPRADGQQAGGTYPTGMHSCSYKCSCNICTCKSQPMVLYHMFILLFLEQCFEVVSRSSGVNEINMQSRTIEFFSN